MSLKLLEMGCIPGEEVKLNSRAPLGDPITIIVNDYTLSLRLDEAATIKLKA
nr:FeoA family protein [Rufibacter sp. SYSU D00308]